MLFRRSFQSELIGVKKILILTKSIRSSEKNELYRLLQEFLAQYTKIYVGKKTFENIKSDQEIKKLSLGLYSFFNKESELELDINFADFNAAMCRLARFFVDEYVDPYVSILQEYYVDQLREGFNAILAISVVLFLIFILAVNLFWLSSDGLIFGYDLIQLLIPLLFFSMAWFVVFTSIMLRMTLIKYRIHKGIFGTSSYEARILIEYILHKENEGFSPKWKNVFPEKVYQELSGSVKSELGEILA